MFLFKIGISLLQNLAILCLLNNILRNAVRNSQKQNGEEFVALPNIQHLTANTLRQRYEFARAAITGCKLLRQVSHADRQQIDEFANARRSIPVIELD